jgi:high-affinity nickel permease
LRRWRWTKVMANRESLRLSVAVALAIGTIELLQVPATRLRDEATCRRRLAKLTGASENE